MGENHRGRKPLPHGRKMSEMISLKVTPDQFRAFLTLGDRYWLRYVLDAEIANTPACKCGEYHGKFSCAMKMENPK